MDKYLLVGIRLLLSIAHFVIDFFFIKRINKKIKISISIIISIILICIISLSFSINNKMKSIEEAKNFYWHCLHEAEQRPSSLKVIINMFRSFEAKDAKKETINN